MRVQAIQVDETCQVVNL